MKEFEEHRDTGEKARRAFLVSVRDDKIGPEEASSLARELEGLAYTLGLEIAGRELVRVREGHSRYGMGSGKAAELTEKAREIEADCLVFDSDLTPSWQRNWEKLCGIPVVDRQELIIQIFASRAKTREAELQVTLAELTWSLPRLRHKYIDLSRQRGGRYGTRGSGETRLETDRRLVERRIHQLEEELEQVRLQREVRRKKREREGLPVCALVGYTNAGKSSLLNALTRAGVLAEDKLFATLDAVSRRFELEKGRPVLLVDTVGFIRRLPHSLIKAFRSTLEEAALADILIHVLDASESDIDDQYQTTLSVLRELNAGDVPRITVLNKADLLTGPGALEALKQRYPGGIALSSLNPAGAEEPGFGELVSRIQELLGSGLSRFRFPPERPDLAALLRRNGEVLSEKYGDCIEVEARTNPRTLGRLREYLVNNGA